MLEYSTDMVLRKMKSITIERAEIESVQQDKNVEEEILERSIKQRASSILNNTKLNKKIKNYKKVQI